MKRLALAVMLVCACSTLRTAEEVKAAQVATCVRVFKRTVRACMEFVEPDLGDVTLSGSGAYSSGGTTLDLGPGVHLDTNEGPPPTGFKYRNRVCDCAPGGADAGSGYCCAHGKPIVWCDEPSFGAGVCWP